VFVTEGAVSVVVLNDTDQPWQGELALSRQRFDGRPLATATVAVDAGPRTSTPIALPPEVGMPDDPTAEVVSASLDTHTAVHTFVPDVEMAMDPSPLEVDVSASEDGYAVTVTARSLARDVTLLADRVAADATVDDALITLLAGRSATFQVRTSARDLGQALSKPPVLRTANDLQYVERTLAHE
jgi:beta-mannosidase